MKKPPEKLEPKIIEKRFTAALARALTTPHKPHKPLKAKKGTSNDKNRTAKVDK
ncbi:MAG: hypothetical protein ABL936_18525 [Aestuariivirga sp.]